MTHYSNRAKDDQAKNIATQVQARLAKVGIKSEVTNNWYHYQLMVQDPQPYVAFRVLECDFEHLEKLERKLVVCFDTFILSKSDGGEILYRGANFKEDLENFPEKLFEEVKRQNDSVKQKVQREAELAEEVRQATLSLQRLRSDFPAYAGSLRTVGSSLYLELQGLTEDRIRQVLNLIGSA